MKVINVKISNKIAICKKKHLISANDNYIVKFDFDKEWEGIDEKTAWIFADEEKYEIPFFGNCVELSKIPPCSELAISVSSAHLSSTAAYLGCIISDTDLKSDEFYL